MSHFWSMSLTKVRIFMCSFYSFFNFSLNSYILHNFTSLLCKSPHSLFYDYCVLYLLFHLSCHIVFRTINLTKFIYHPKYFHTIKAVWSLISKTLALMICYECIVSLIFSSSRIGELMSEVISKYGVVWVVSAGNHGPALCTIGSPPDVSANSMIGIQF
jgi:hypothetical protein